MARKNAVEHVEREAVELINPKTEPREDTEKDTSIAGDQYATDTTHVEESGPVSLGADPVDNGDQGLVSPNNKPGDDVGLISPSHRPGDTAVAMDGAGGPAPAAGMGRIIEDAPGIGGAMDAPIDDPTDLSAFGSGPGLPDLGIDDGGFGATSPTRDGALRHSKTRAAGRWTATMTCWPAYPQMSSAPDPWSIWRSRWERTPTATKSWRIS